MPADIELKLPQKAKRGPGRPKGSRNIPLLSKGVVTPPGPQEVGWDYKHADIDTLVARQLTLLDWAQQAVANELRRAYQGRGLTISVVDIDRLTALSLALVRTIDGLKKSSELAEEIAARLSPSQLLEAALKKVEAQDTTTVRAAIRRLRAYLEKLGPVTPNDERQMSGRHASVAASDAITSLEDE